MNLKSDLKLWFDDLDEVVLDSFELYAQELLRFNKAINLISSTTTDKLAKVHFADCVKACQIMFKHLPQVF